MDNNNNGILVGILIGIVVMLLVFCGLFMTNTISFKSKNDINDNMNSSNELKENPNNAIATDTKYYQYYYYRNDLSNCTTDDFSCYNLDILQLNNDGTATYKGHKSAAGSWNYKGTYTENDSQIIFKGYATGEFKEVLGTEEYSITFKKNNNTLIDELRNWTYTLVTKEELKEQ